MDLAAEYYLKHIESQSQFTGLLMATSARLIATASRSELTYRTLMQLLAVLFVVITGLS